MTSLSVRQYVTGIYNKLGLKERDVTKVQTGGPGKSCILSLIRESLILDRKLKRRRSWLECVYLGFVDLHTFIWLFRALDEILLGSEKTIAVIDGSGVLYDPVGIDRIELVRLAKARKMISNFDRSHLSKDGYVVLIGEQDVKLPCETVKFYIYYGRLTLMIQLERLWRTAQTSVTLLIWGLKRIFLYHAEDGRLCPRIPTFWLEDWSSFRPEAINISNVASLVDSEGKPHYKYIVEGANLFITQQARLYLEKRKVILFKDSSANKVRSSLSTWPCVGLSTPPREVFSVHPSTSLLVSR